MYDSVKSLIWTWFFKVLIYNSDYKCFKVTDKTFETNQSLCDVFIFIKCRAFYSFVLYLFTLTKNDSYFDS